jgi:hypothetical protein
MVDPVSDQDRKVFMWKLKAGFVAMIGLSAGLITLRSDAGMTGFLIAAGMGLLVGGVALWIAFPSGD